MFKRLVSPFLDASTHLYKRVCPSISQSVGPSVGPSVSRFFLITEIGKSDKSKPENLTNLTKSDKSLCNSILVPSFGRIFVRTNLLETISLTKQGHIDNSTSRVRVGSGRNAVLIVFPRDRQVDRPNNGLTHLQNILKRRVQCD